MEPHPGRTTGGLLNVAPRNREKGAPLQLLVGHTDMTGALDANIALSRRRAEAVRERLLRDHGLNRDRIDAQGAGWLAPRASNATKAGRAANRRVEVVVSGG